MPFRGHPTFNMRAKPVEFRAPEGSVPEGTKSGEEFDLVCTFRVKHTGDVCLVRMGDTEMPGYDAKERPQGKQGYGEMADEMINMR